jgi:hypothetical protein
MELDHFSFPKLWAQVRSKSWLWLFRRQQIEEGGRLFKHGDVGLAGVHVCAANEVEIIAGVGTGLFNSASVTAHLRLRTMTGADDDLALHLRGGNALPARGGADADARS